jgi:toxin ParE1/3/4
MVEHRRLVWSAAADDDLVSIWLYGANKWSPSTADNHLRKIRAAGSRLSRKSMLGRARDGPLPGMRSILVKPHLLFYRVSTAAIEVIRVMHEHDDIEIAFR